MEKEFDIFKKELNYKCPVCKKDFSVEDRICPHCKLDLYKLFLDKIKFHVEIFKAIADPLPWKIWEIFITLLIYLIFIISFDEFFYKNYISSKINSQTYFLIKYISFTVANILLAFLPYYFVSIKRNLSIYILGINRIKHQSKDYYLTIIVSLLFALPMIIAVKFQILYQSWIYDSYFMIFEVGNNYYFYILMVLNFLILDPIVTEIFFRGFVYNKLKLKLNNFFSAIIVSTIYILSFSILTGNFILLLILFFLNIFFCVNFDYKFSVWNNMEIKLAINTILFILFFNNFYLLSLLSFEMIIYAVVAIFVIIFILELFRIKNRYYSIFKLYDVVKVFFIIVFSSIILFGANYLYSSTSFEEVKVKDFYNSHSLQSSIIFIENKKVMNLNSKIFLAGLYYTNGDFEKSLSLCKEIQKKLSSAEDAIGLNNLIALNYSELNKNLDIAFKLVQELYNKHQLPSYYETMGWLYFKIGNISEAERILSEYIKFNEDTDVKSMVEVNYHLGMIYFSKKDFLNAKKYFTKSFQGFPESYFGKVSSEYLNKIENELRDKTTQ